MFNVRGAKEKVFLEVITCNHDLLTCLKQVETHILFTY